MRSDSQIPGDANQKGTERPEEEGLSERVVERVRRVCTVDGQVWVTGEERWDALSIRSALGKGQELKIHVDYAGDTEGVSKRDSSEG